MIASVWLAPGTTIANLVVTRLIGQGGFGAVYLAKDLRLDRNVALKIAHPERGDLWREARAAARLAHPNIVAIYEIGDHGGRPYVVMEYVEGAPLADRLGAPMPATEAMRVVRELASALAAAHAAGLLHLDLTPANVLLAADGRARIVDFGLAQPVGSPAGNAGTAAYMAPEQWRGERLGAAADIWALGAIAHALLIGGPPITGSPATIREHACSAGALVLELRDVAPELAGLVRSCLRKAPLERPPAAELVGIVDRLIARSRDPSASPFRGLEAFDEASAARFHGRDEVVRSVLALLTDQSLALVGPSGAGKSSLLHAGIAPALRTAGWKVIPVRPGRQPLATLATALHATIDSAALATGDADGEPVTAAPDLAARWTARPALFGLDLADAADAIGRIAILIDQLEELETVSLPDQRAAAAAALAEAASVDPKVRIVVTLRDDFLGKIAARAHGVIDRVVVLTPPGRAALRTILEQPLLDFGYRFEDDAMLRAIVDEVASEPGALALIQSLGVALWEHRDPEQRLITRAAFAAIGGVAGAFAIHAQRVLAGCTPDEAALLRALVLRLLTPEGTRRPLSRERLLDGLPAAATVLDRLVVARVVIARDSQDLELVHEALTTRWPALAAWIDASHGERAALGELDAAAGLWERKRHDAALLWNGAALRDAERTLARASDVRPLLHRFVDESRRRERGVRVRQRIALALALATLATVVVIFAVQRARARESAALATTRSAEARVQAAWGVLRDGRMLESRALLRAAVDTADTDGATELWWRLGFEPVEWRVERRGLLEAITWLPDGTGILAGRIDIARIDRDTARVTALGAHEDSLMAATTNGTLAITGGIDGTIRRWDPLPRIIARHADPILALAIAGDGAIAAGDAGGRVSIWTRDGAERERFAIAGGVAELAWSPAGRLAVIDMRGDVHVRAAAPAVYRGVGATRLAYRGEELLAGTSSGDVRALETGAVLAHANAAIGALVIRDGELIYAAGNELRTATTTIGRTRGTIRAARLSPDRRRLAVLSGAATVELWRLDRAPPPPPRGFAGSVRDVAITPDKTAVVGAGDDGVVRVFDVATGALRHAAETGHGRVRALAIDLRGEAVLTGGDDGTVRRWRLPDLTGGAVIATHRDAVTAIGIARDGTIATGSADRTVVVSRPNAAPVTFDAGSPIYDVVFDANDHAISLGDDRRVIRWDADPDVLHAGVVNTSDIAVSADGKRLAVVGASPQTIIDLDTGGRREIATGHVRWQYAAFAPDGRLFVTGTNRLARIVDPDGTRAPRDLASHGAPIADGEWSADGTLIATAGDDGLAGLWNAGDGTLAWGGATSPGSMEVVVGPVTFHGAADGLVTATGVAQAEVLQLRLHGAIASLALAGDALVATSITGDRATLDITRLRARGCDLVRAVRAEVPITSERGAIVPAPDAAPRCPTARR